MGYNRVPGAKSPEAIPAAPSRCSHKGRVFQTHLPSSTEGRIPEGDRTKKEGAWVAREGRRALKERLKSSLRKEEEKQEFVRHEKSMPRKGTDVLEVTDEDS